jgi:L-asparagine transporter-like permease
VADVPDTPDGGESSGSTDEKERERLDRELMELVNELRVALTGVQVLFAFLLTVPFTQRFAKVTEFQRHLFYVVLLSATLSVLLLIAPTARHRLLFRQHDKERIVVSSNRYAIGGLAVLAVAMTGAVMLITDLLFKESMVTWVTAILSALFVAIWFVVPALRRVAHDG